MKAILRLRCTPAYPVKGFTLIELMVAIALFALLMLVAMPMYGTFINNTQIRTATESLLAGVRLAQTEAVKRNGDVEFVLDEAKGWKVNNLEDGAEIQSSEFFAGAPNAVVKPDGDARRVTFNGLGRIVAKNPADDTAPLARVDVTTAAIASPRALRLVVGTAYGIKVCDPALAAADPAGCP